MAKVCLLSTSLVRPKTPTPQPCEHTLSAIDRLPTCRNYVKQVYYYKEALSPSDDFSALASKLEESLSSTLSHFYPLAGRVEVRDHKTGSLFIICNDAGIPFRTAVAECHLADWSDLGQPDACSDLESQLHDPGKFSLSNLRESAIIKIQVTKFLCGSIALGCVASEMVVDGVTGFSFLNAWSAMHKVGKISMLPLVLDSEILKPRDPPEVNVPIKTYRAQPAPSSCAQPPLVDGGAAVPPRYKTKLFAFTADKIDALVHEIRAGPHGSSTAVWPTSFEALAGLAWKCITEARQLPDYEKTFSNHLISLKGNIKRWSPRIPANYIGNTVFPGTTEAIARDIKENHVSYAVKRVHEDIKGVSLEMMKSTLDWIHAQMEKGLVVDFTCDLHSGKELAIVALHSFPVYDADFGWGRPLHYSFILDPHCGDGIAYILPTPHGGRSRYLLVVLPEEPLDRLSTHSLFLKFATPAKVCTTTATSSFGMPACKA